MRIMQFLLLSLILFIAGCSVDPVSGKSSLNFFSEKDEIAMGKQYHPLLVKQYKEYSDPQLKKYIQKIVSTLGDVSHRPNLEYEVTLLDTPMINAFAIPGGHVYITRGLLYYLNNEAELTGVMAHELGHVNARHSVEKLSVQRSIDLGVIFGSLLFFKKKEDRQSFLRLGQLGSVLGQLQYSRENEMEADRLAINYSVQAGYSPLGLESTMQMFKKMQEVRGGTNPLGDVLSTHPMSKYREIQARQEIRKLDEEEKEYSKEMNRDIYLDKINSLILARNPQAGTIINNKYYNTSYLLSIDIPEGFKTIIENDKYLFITYKESPYIAAFFQTYDSEKFPPSRTKKLFEEQIGLSSTQITPFEHSYQNRNIFHYLSKEKDSSGKYLHFSYNSETRNSITYEVIVIEKKTDTKTDPLPAKDILFRTHFIDQREAALIKPKYLSIITTSKEDSWKSLTIKHFGAGTNPKYLAYFNGRTETDPLPEKIKVGLFLQKGY